MKYGRLADFFFVGLGVIPAALMFAGLPDVAMLLFIPLMFVACLFGMAEQIEDTEKPKGETDAGAGSPQREAPGLTFRKAKE